MQDVQKRRIDALHSALAFLNEHYALLTAEIRAIVDNFRRLVAEIDALAADQEPPALTRGAHLRKEADFVRAQMLRVAASTRRLYRDEPSVLAALRVPHKRASVSAVCDAAATMCTALERHSEYLAAEQVDVNRIVRLSELGEALAALEKTFAATTPKRQVATRRLPKLLTDALREMHAIGRLLPEVEGLHAAHWPHITRTKKRVGRKKKRRPRQQPPANDAGGETSLGT